MSMLPIADTSDLESELDSNDEGNENDEYSNKIYNILSYKQIHEQYSLTQKNFENDHKYEWASEEKVYLWMNIPMNEYLLKESDIKKIFSLSPTELFEMFFSSEINMYILEASAKNGLCHCLIWIYLLGL